MSNLMEQLVFSHSQTTSFMYKNVAQESTKKYQVQKG